MHILIGARRSGRLGFLFRFERCELLAELLVFGDRAEFLLNRLRERNPLLLRVLLDVGKRRAPFDPGLTRGFGAFAPYLAAAAFAEPQPERRSPSGGRRSRAGVADQ